MRTIKRSIPDINTDIDNYSKYLNQFNWKGINEAKNIFEVDQESFKECNNVFIDYDDRLVTRNPLQQELLDPKEVLPEDSELIKIENYGKVQVLVYHNSTGYAITAINGEYTTTTGILNGIQKYHLATLGQYIICFNDKGARVYDTLNITKGWQPLYNFVDLPVIKRIVGGTVTEYPSNQFTKSYKEEYVWSDNSRPTLPKRKSASNVEVTSERESINWTLPNTNILTDYRILRKLNIKFFEDDLISIAGSTICVARSTYCLLSYDEGNTFTKIEYPAYDRFCNIASISKDGNYFFFVAMDAVYRYSFETESWSYIEYATPPISSGKTPGKQLNQLSESIGIGNSCCFLTGDIFSFLLYIKSDASTNNYFVRLYSKGPNIKDMEGNNNGELVYIDCDSSISYSVSLKDNICYNDKMSKDCNTFRTKMFYDNSTNTSIVAAIIRAQESNEINSYILINGLTGTKEYGQIEIKRNKLTVGYISQISYNYNTYFDDSSCVNLSIIGKNNTNWSRVSIYIGDKTLVETTYMTYVVTVSETLNFTKDLVPFELLGGWIAGSEVYSTDFTESQFLPLELKEQNRINTFIINDFLYVQYGNDVYTNNFSTSDSALLTYIYEHSNDIFTEVPNCSYSGSELYLGFGNTLKITSNIQKDNALKLSLPPINNQSFIDSINGIINISTTDVALFFKDKITICTKAEDNTFGFRYDYYNTKLSLGIEANDSIINTLEGSYTVFPTKRGLAFMTYQQFMSTTDQIVTYITDPIENLWEQFYLNKKYIKIIQWRQHLVLTNGSNIMLLFDFRNTSWWKWTVPLNTSEALTYQDSLKIISKQLYIFKESDDRYFDFPKTANQKPINWLISSQNLHFNAPNYYKNLKQLIFKLSETNNLKNTINVQIKLYRKSVTLKEPDVIDFKIDELRTFVKRFNYWKINELQWKLSNDNFTKIPARLILNGVSIKYEIGEEVR